MSFSIKNHDTQDTIGGTYDSDLYHFPLGYTGR